MKFRYTRLGALVAGAAVTLVAAVIAMRAPAQFSGNIETFDGAPSSPLAFSDADWDIQVHERGMYRGANNFIALNGQHGTNCSAPPAAHPVTAPEQAVYICNNHVMTAISGDGYAVIYLTPNRLLDWSDGEASLSFDISTARTADRDWWNVWLTEWEGQMTLPLSDRFGAAGVDLNGPPENFVNVELAIADDCILAERDEGVIASSGCYSANSFTERDTFVLTVHGSTFDFCKPDESICFVQDKPHGLGTTQAVVTFGHHAYDPTKGANPQGGQGAANTWHWDNVAMSDAVPFTLIRANERARQTSGTFTFPEPAPANSYLRFSAVGAVSINGQAVSPQNTIWSDHHFSSYFVPIPAGTTSVAYTGQTGWWGCCASMMDVSIVSQTTTAPPTATPTDTPVPPTNTPTNTPTPTFTPTPTNTPVATPVTYRCQRGNPDGSWTTVWTQAGGGVCP